MTDLPTSHLNITFADGTSKHIEDYGKHGTEDLQAVYDFNAQIFAEDQDMVESQKPEELPLDISMEAHFEADRSSTTYRRILAEWGLSKRYVV